jgi:hypothetical protein
MDELGFGQAAPTQVKKEQAVFKSLRPPPSGVIELDTPSPAQKKQKSNTCSSATMPLPSNPSNAVLALSSPDEEEEQSLERALEAEMDTGFPSVEEKTPKALHDVARYVDRLSCSERMFDLHMCRPSTKDAYVDC